MHADDDAGSYAIVITDVISDLFVHVVVHVVFDVDGTQNVEAKLEEEACCVVGKVTKPFGSSLPSDQLYMLSSFPFEGFERGINIAIVVATVVQLV